MTLATGGVCRVGRQRHAGLSIICSSLGHVRLGNVPKTRLCRLYGADRSPLVIGASDTAVPRTSDSTAFQMTKSFAGTSTMHRDAATAVLRLQLPGGGFMRRQIGCINLWPVIELLVVVMLTVAAGFGLKHGSPKVCAD
jgi:hypothetical protein